MEKKKLIHSIVWSTIYIIIHGLLTTTGSLLFPKAFLMFCGIVGGIYILIHAFFMKYRRNWLFISGLISAFAVTCLGIMIGNRLGFEDVIAIGAAISVVDILSFTKYGKHTANAKAMSNIHFMSKLIVYGKEKDDVLVPTCGIGDYFYYSIWISGIHTVSNSIYAYLGSSGLILLGSCIHYAIIIKLSQKENYKGFPATVIPFLCVLLLYIGLH